MLFRILTEDKNRQFIERIVRTDFYNFTILTAKGYWEGEEEASLVIEIEALDCSEPRIISVARKIKDLNEQDAVLVQAIPLTSKLV